jgi:hypothetical protein
MTLSAGEPGTTLIMCKDDKTCIQIQEYLEYGGKQMLKNHFTKYLEAKIAKQNSVNMTTQKQAYTKQAKPATGSKSLGRGRGRSKKSAPSHKMVSSNMTIDYVTLKTQIDTNQRLDKDIN